ncbi:hypothetical protein WN51_14065 [Melipona quadrifasciata]|uniref:Uncharacterized protein n=1 Tax=Melipona quadrifasciata TaxID=166423 RepID=A0A0M9A0Q4_9HYME|nr:hypothetical protein WN51_14065 [Melipona quadrifasciata]
MKRGNLDGYPLHRNQRVEFICCTVLNKRKLFKGISSVRNLQAFENQERAHPNRGYKNEEMI